MTEGKYPRVSDEGLEILTADVERVPMQMVRLEPWAVKDVVLDLVDARAQAMWRGARIDQLSSSLAKAEHSAREEKAYRIRIERAAERHRDHAAEMSQALTEANRAAERIAVERDGARALLRDAAEVLKCVGGVLREMNVCNPEPLHTPNDACLVLHDVEALRARIEGGASS